MTRPNRRKTRCREIPLLPVHVVHEMTTWSPDSDAEFEICAHYACVPRLGDLIGVPTVEGTAATLWRGSDTATVIQVILVDAPRAHVAEVTVKRIWEML